MNYKKTNLVIIIPGIVFLVVAFFVGSPFEFLNSAVDTIMTLLAMLLIVVIFVYLFMSTRRIEKRLIRWLAIILLGILGLPYLWVGIWTAILIDSNDPPKWQDVSIYTNIDGEKVISQWRETSGSIYDYRDRKIIGEFGQFRISYECDKKDLKGVWSEYDLKSHARTTVDFEKEK